MYRTRDQANSGRKRDAGHPQMSEVKSVGRSPVRSPALKRAERARGLTLISSLPGDSGRRLRSWKLGAKCASPLLRQMARAARRRAGAGDEVILDDAVFQRMEGHHHQPAARPQQALGGGEGAGQLDQLVVDEDAQRLEGAGRRVHPRPRRAADDAGDEVGEVERRLERLLLAPLADRPGDDARAALLAERRDDAGEVALVVGVDDIGADGPRCDMRMSSGPSCMKEKPRSASSICGEEMPISSMMPSTASMPAPASSSAISLKRPARKPKRAPHSAAKGARAGRVRVTVDGEETAVGGLQHGTGIAAGAKVPST